MPSKFGEFRFLGGKSGVKSQVAFQAQFKSTSGTWYAASNKVDCPATNIWVEEGMPIIMKDPGNWNAQQWNTSTHKRILVQIKEDTNGNGQPNAMYGTFLTQDDVHNLDVVSGSVVVLSNTVRYGFVGTDATTYMPEPVAELVNWGMGECEWKPNPS